MTLRQEKRELTGYPVSKIKDVVDLTLQLLDNLLDVAVQSLRIFNPRSWFSQLSTLFSFLLADQSWQRLPCRTWIHSDPQARLDFSPNFLQQPCQERATTVTSCIMLSCYTHPCRSEADPLRADWRQEREWRWTQNWPRFRIRGINLRWMDTREA